jgi:predicted glycoside hydrolase/deacetylase ChbG (UPF0249 family)
MNISVHPRFVVEIVYWTSQFTLGLLWRSFIEHLSSPLGLLWRSFIEHLSSPPVCCGDRLLSISIHPRFVVEIVYWASQFTPRFVVEIVYWASQFTLGLLWRSFIEHLSSPSVCCGDRLLSISVHPSVCCGVLNISVHPRFVVEYWTSQFTPRFVVEYWTSQFTPRFVVEYWTSQFTLGLLWRSFIEHLSSPSVCCGDRLLSISVHPRFVVEIVYWASQYNKPRGELRCSINDLHNKPRVNWDAQ